MELGGQLVDAHRVADALGLAGGGHVRARRRILEDPVRHPGAVPVGAVGALGALLAGPEVIAPRLAGRRCICAGSGRRGRVHVFRTNALGA